MLDFAERAPRGVSIRQCLIHRKADRRKAVIKVMLSGETFRSKNEANAL